MKSNHPTILKRICVTVVAWQLGLSGCTRDPRLEEEQMMQDDTLEPAYATDLSETESAGIDADTSISVLESPLLAEDAKLEENTDSSASDEIMTDTSELAEVPTDEANRDDEPLPEEPSATTLASNEEAAINANDEIEEAQDYSLGTGTGYTTPNPGYLELPKQEKAAKRGKSNYNSNTASYSNIGDAAPLAEGEARYVVTPGDTLSRIARRIYGNVNAWRELAEFNNLSRPERIFPGDVIRFRSDDRTKAFETAYRNKTQQKVVVQSGDTLQKIAKRLLGSSAYWKTLWHLNADKVKNPNKIRANQVLYYVEMKKLSQNVTPDTH